MLISLEPTNAFIVLNSVYFRVDIKNMNRQKLHLYFQQSEEQKEQVKN